MSDWPGWAALGLSTATAGRGEYLRVRNNATTRNTLIDNVVNTYDTSDLFVVEAPDFDVRGLVDAANRWKKHARGPGISQQTFTGT
jgi:hypothetical protein